MRDVKVLIARLGTRFNMMPDAPFIDKMPLETFFGQAVCFDVSHVPKNSLMSTVVVNYNSVISNNRREFLVQKGQINAPSPNDALAFPGKDPARKEFFQKGYTRDDKKYYFHV